MARTNVKPKSSAVRTHEGAPAVANLKPMEQLRRSLLTCFLWESQFYVDGVEIADHIASVAAKCDPEEVAKLAVEARTVHNLRHAPLLLLKVLAKTGAGKPGLVSGAIAQTIQRADELAEFMALYHKDGRQKLAAQVKKGLRKAFEQFDAYQLSKWNRDGAWKMRDVAFLAHVKPTNAERGRTYAKLVNKSYFPAHTKSSGFAVKEAYGLGEYESLPSPDTWEVALSGGANKKETFERLLREEKLGYLALLRNLRNMEQAGVDRELVRRALLARKGAQRVLPFRYVAAARAAPTFEPAIDAALQAAIAELPPLKGCTGVLVDVSGSMDMPLSGKSDMKRMDAAAALAAIVNAEDLVVGTFSNELKIVPARRGMAGVDAVIKSQPHGSTYLGRSLAEFEKKHAFDRIIVVTDEQSHDRVVTPKVKHAYLINVASYKNGIGYRDGWVHIDGFSESVLKFIHAYEAEAL